MKYSKKFICSKLGALGIILACLFIWIFPVVTTSPQERAQQSLAKELGVEIEDYPSKSSFPGGYFYVILKPGMSISEVHKIMRAYEKVLHCGQTIEVYYYLSANAEDAKQIWVIYDKNGKFAYLTGNDSDSGNQDTEWCVAGLLEG